MAGLPLARLRRLITKHGRSNRREGSPWHVADLLRGDLRQSPYGRVILPFTLLRGLQCVLARRKDAVLEAVREHADKPVGGEDTLLLRAAGQPFYN